MYINVSVMIILVKKNDYVMIEGKPGRYMNACIYIICHLCVK